MPYTRTHMAWHLSTQWNDDNDENNKWSELTQLSSTDLSTRE